MEFIQMTFHCIHLVLFVLSIGTNIKNHSRFMPKQQGSCTTISESFDPIPDDISVEVSISLISNTFILPNIASEIFTKPS
jgi:hypothetical protein